MRKVWISGEGYRLHNKSRRHDANRKQQRRDKKRAERAAMIEAEAEVVAYYDDGYYTGNDYGWTLQDEAYYGNPDEGYYGDDYYNDPLYSDWDDYEPEPKPEEYSYDPYWGYDDPYGYDDYEAPERCRHCGRVI